MLCAVQWFDQARKKKTSNAHFYSHSKLSKETVVQHWWESNLVLSTEMITQIGHQKEFQS